MISIFLGTLVGLALGLLVFSVAVVLFLGPDTIDDLFKE